MKKLKSAISFLSCGPFYDLSVFSLYIASYVTGTQRQDVQVLSPQELDELLQSGHSLIRLGDGEAMLMTGRDIHYQKKSRELNHDLRLIIKEYPSSSYILAIPIDALSHTDTTLRATGRFRIWRLFRCFATKRLNMSLRYADAHSFYRQEYLQLLLPNLLRGKHVCCVSKQSTLDSVLQTYLERHAAKVTFIQSPKRDSYEVLPSLYTQIHTALQQSTLPSLVVLSAGPASKVLSHQLSKEAIQCIDIGHGLEIVGRDKDYSDKI